MNPFENQSLSQPLWRYGLFAIDSELLVESAIHFDSEHLVLCDQKILRSEIDRVIVVGAGKAGSGMAKGFLKSWSRHHLDIPLQGIVIVPDNCVEDLERIKLHGGRPASVNEPTRRGMEGARQMLELVRSAGSRDLVICLISGGGSALAPLPVDGVELNAKQAMTRFLSQNGASINELNCVRSAISQIKAGGLVRDFQGHSLHAFIISDVLGNPLSTIASGMTVDQPVNIKTALSVLAKYDPDRTHIDSSIFEAIEKQKDQNTETRSLKKPNVFNQIIGDNAKCVSAMAHMARQLGYEVEAESAEQDEGDVGKVADRLWNVLENRIQNSPLIRPYCFISGGEPTVTVSNRDSKGGRNQHLAMLMLQRLMRSSILDSTEVEFVSLGTDGEDGPTDAAGAWFDRSIVEQTKTLDLNPAKFIEQNNSYPFFEQNGGLIKTGPTHTNVCDIRILVLGERKS